MVMTTRDLIVAAQSLKKSIKSAAVRAARSTPRFATCCVRLREVPRPGAERHVADPRDGRCVPQAARARVRAFLRSVARRGAGGRALRRAALSGVLRRVDVRARARCVEDRVRRERAAARLLAHRTHRLPGTSSTSSASAAYEVPRLEYLRDAGARQLRRAD